MSLRLFASTDTLNGQHFHPVFQDFSGLIYKLSRKIFFFFSFPYGVVIYRWPTENSPWPMVVPKSYLKIITYGPVQKLHKGYS